MNIKKRTYKELNFNINLDTNNLNNLKNSYTPTDKAISLLSPLNENSDMPIRYDLFKVNKKNIPNIYYKKAVHYRKGLYKNYYNTNNLTNINNVTSLNKNNQSKNILQEMKQEIKKSSLSQKTLKNPKNLKKNEIQSIDLLDRQKLWEQTKNAKKLELEKNIRETEESECKFSPQINTKANTNRMFQSNSNELLINPNSYNDYIKRMKNKRIENYISLCESNTREVLSISDLVTSFNNNSKLNELKELKNNETKKYKFYNKIEKTKINKIQREALTPFNGINSNSKNNVNKKQNKFSFRKRQNTSVKNINKNNIIVNNNENIINNLSLNNNSKIFSNINNISKQNYDKDKNSQYNLSEKSYETYFTTNSEVKKCNLHKDISITIFNKCIFSLHKILYSIKLEN